MEKMRKIIIKGMASGKIVKELVIDQPHKNLSLMDFLLQNKITIASSCGGAGTCKKCVVNQNLLSCQISIKEFLYDKDCAIVEVAYL